MAYAKYNIKLILSGLGQSPDVAMHHLCSIIISWYEPLFEAATTTYAIVRCTPAAPQHYTHTPNTRPGKRHTMISPSVVSHILYRRYTTCSWCAQLRRGRARASRDRASAAAHHGQMARNCDARFWESPADGERGCCMGDATLALR